MAYFYRDLTIGVLGGGQLGRMLIQAGIDLNVQLRVMDPAPDAPCKPLAHEFVQGSLTDYEAVMAFGEPCDLLTIEIENVQADALAALKAMGKRVYPDPDIIKLIQDKRAQKQFYAEHGFPTAAFHLVENQADVRRLQAFLPAVNKLARAGYDGRGVQVLKDASMLSQAFDAPGLLEKFVDFEKELAVIVARNAEGAIQTFPLVEMVFHPEHNLVEYLIAPAEVDARIERQADELARAVVEQLDFVGLLAIELFLTKEGTLLINEMAPRPHNSGHHSIRSCYTSQYEQHLRAILDLPLGKTDLLCPAAMVNLLGAAGHTGPVRYQGVEKLLAMEGVYPHFYGKSTTKPHRKMGHVTILDTDHARMLEKIAYIKQHLRVLSDTPFLS